MHYDIVNTKKIRDKMIAFLITLNLKFD